MHTNMHLSRSRFAPFRRRLEAQTESAEQGASRAGAASRATVAFAALAVGLCGSLPAQGEVGASVVEASASAEPVFDYPWRLKDYDNGLRVVTVPTGQPGVVCTYIVVSVGSRNETEKGKSGFAHFFEHMMFRGTKKHTSAEQAAFFKEVGADRNAYTTSDYTAYHTTFATEDLDAVLAMEADRFQNLAYTKDMLRTEAMAILGEYNKNAANPISRVLEKTRETAFTSHTYGHTTMGYLRDVHAMPRQYDHSLEFFNRFYRPEYTTVLVVGDVQPDQVESIVAQHWGGWERGTFKQEIEPEPAQDGPRGGHVEWSSPTQPWTTIHFKGPGFSPEGGGDLAALTVLFQLAFGENSALYKELVVRTQKADVIFSSADEATDPYLLSLFARTRDVADLAFVEGRILDTCQQFKTRPVDAAELERVISHLRYGFLSELTDAESIAGALAGSIARARTPEAVDRSFADLAKVTPADVMAAAKEYLVTEKRTIVTLSHERMPSVANDPDASPVGDVDEAASAEVTVADPVVASNFEFDATKRHTLIPTMSPLVQFRLVFEHGAVEDPVGKEGLAYVTASMLGSGGTNKRSYEELLAAMYPLAASVGVSVDKEMTVFSGTAHRDVVQDYWSMMHEMLWSPGFREDDFARIKADTVSYLDTALRRSDDEELGKQVIYDEVFHGTRYGHPNSGSIATVEALTLDDVREFYAKFYRRSYLRIGLAGRYPGDLPERIEAAAPPGDEFTEASHSVDPIESTRMTIVQKDTASTGLHLGFPIDVNRNHPDWVALWLTRSYFGEHRSENSYLYQRLREIRGLNYGDYAYIEHFPGGGRSFQPPPGVVRGHQLFQIWIRPVVPQNAAFALKAAWFELDKLVTEGISQEAFDATATFLNKQVNLLVKTDARRLGYAMDQKWYGIDREFAQFVKAQLETLTRDKVNAAIRKHLRSDRLQIVAITKDAEGLRDAVLGDAPTSISYQAPPAEEILAEDKIIERLQLPLTADGVRIVPVERIFADAPSKEKRR